MTFSHIVMATAVSAPALHAESDLSSNPAYTETLDKQCHFSSAECRQQWKPPSRLVVHWYVPLVRCLVWKLAKGSLTDMARGGLQGELSCSPLLANCRPHRKRPTSCILFWLLYRPVGGGKSFCLPSDSLATSQPMRDYYNSANEHPSFLQWTSCL